MGSPSTPSSGCKGGVGGGSGGSGYQGVYGGTTWRLHRARGKKAREQVGGAAGTEGPARLHADPHVAQLDAADHAGATRAGAAGSRETRRHSTGDHLGRRAGRQAQTVGPAAAPALLLLCWQSAAVLAVSSHPHLDSSTCNRPPPLWVGGAAVTHLRPWYLPSSPHCFSSRDTRMSLSGRKGMGPA